MIRMNSTQGAVGRGKAMIFVLAALVTVMLLAAGESALGRPSLGHTFTVNSTGDQTDADLANSTCDVDLATTGSQCTLRAAIQEANDTPNDTFNDSPVNDVIRFNITGNGVQTIQPVVGFPLIAEAVTIDGYTQPGTSKNTLARGTNAVLLIELDGTNAGDRNGLNFVSSNSVVRGLVINRFSLAGIHMLDGGLRIEGNFIGTDASGTVDLGNRFGVDFNSSEGGGTVIGGATPATRNLISGNGVGVFFQNSSAGHEVSGNLIGTKKDGTSALGNASGVVLLSASSNTVRANTIAFSDRGGVEISNLGSLGNRILSNSIFANGRLGIDLKGGNENVAGATANDGDDPATPEPDPDEDTGPNNLQNKPNLTSAKTSASGTTIQGRLNSTPATTFEVQFFSNPSSTNEGKRFMGQISVTTGPDGLATFAFSATQRVLLGQAITATATDSEGNTSEFSAPETAVAQ